jgi:hypothetical protein
VTVPAGSRYTSVGFDRQRPERQLSMTLHGRRPVLRRHATRRHGHTRARPSSAFTATLTLEYNDVRLDEGDFIRSLVVTRFAYFFTPRVMFQTLVQYSNQAAVWAANARFSWLSTAGNGLFIVYNEGRAADGFFQLNEPQARSLILKYSRQFGRSG